MSTIRLVDDSVEISQFMVRDPLLVDLLARQLDPDARCALLERIIVTGARGVASMGVGLDLSELDHRVAKTVNATLVDFERTIADGVGHLAEQLDPGQRSSLVSKALTELASLHDELLAGVDPQRSDSHAANLLNRLSELVGPEGPFTHRLAEALDPNTPHSPLSAGFASLRAEIAALRDLVNKERGRSEESQRGTAKGFEFEMAVESALRGAARPIGAVVEHTGRSTGSLGPAALVGDFLITLPNGCRIAVEVKNQQTISLLGKSGVLDELDRAIANREADAALCISKDAAYPQEVGPFAVYGNRVLVVDDGEGTMIWTGLRWLASHLTIQARADAIDFAAVSDRLQRLRSLCQKFASQRSALTEVGKSVNRVSEGLSDMRDEVLTLVDDLTRQIDSQAATVPADLLTA